MATWLEDILDRTDELESPKSYYYWSSLTAISAVVKRNIYLERFSYKLYPNIFVFLIGHSGIRKGPPVKFAKDLVTRVSNTRVISGRASIQAIIRDLSNARTQENGSILSDSSAFIASGEFAASLVEDPQALTILTDLYDAHYNDKWENTLKGGGEANKTETLKDPYIVLLGASNQVHFRDVIPKTALGGGFIARSFIVLEERRNRLNSLTKRPSKALDVDRSAEYLRMLATIKGEFQWEPDAIERYDEWYYKFGKEDVDDKTGTLSRIGDSVLKVAMLLSLARSPDLQLTAVDIDDALIACQNFYSNINRTMLSGQASTELGKQVGLFLEELIAFNDDENGMSRQNFLRKHWGAIDAQILDRVIDTCMQSGVIKIKRVSAKEIYYKLTEETFKQYSEFNNEKRKE